MQVTYQVATRDQARRFTMTGTDHYEMVIGPGAAAPSRTVICTQQYLRDRLRDIFDNRASHNPVLVIRLRKPYHIFEGVQITGWCSEEGVVRIQYDEMDGTPYSVDLNNIISFQVYS